MSERISSENHLGFAGIDVSVNPPSPRSESLLVSFHDLQKWIHMISFLVVVDSVEVNGGKKKEQKSVTWIIYSNR